VPSRSLQAAVQLSLWQSLPNWSLAIGSNNTKIWCERYVEWYRGAHNRFRGDNGRFSSQSSIGRVVYVLVCRFRGSNIKRPGAYGMFIIMVEMSNHGCRVTIYDNRLSSSTHMGVEEERVFNWKYTDSYKEHDARD
jgi:hypothetical protein